MAVKPLRMAMVAREVSLYFVPLASDSIARSARNAILTAHTSNPVHAWCVIHTHHDATTKSNLCGLASGLRIDVKGLTRWRRRS